MRASVLIPSHSNGPTLEVSVASALAQSHDDLEVLIVGDGIADDGREVAQRLARQDSRVRFYDNPKGPRHGEAHRHRALDQASGEFIFYLSDDDIWLPWHVEELIPRLERSDFVGATVAKVHPDQTLDPLAHDLSLERARKLSLAGKNRLALSGIAHTLAAYRRRSVGWCPAPEDIPTDLYFINGFLSDPQMSAESCARPSALWFPARKERRRMTGDERVAELRRWFSRTRDASGLAAIEREIAESWQRVAMEAGMLAQEQKLKMRRRRARRQARG